MIRLPVLKYDRLYKKVKEFISEFGKIAGYMININQLYSYVLTTTIKN